MEHGGFPCPNPPATVVEFLKALQLFDDMKSKQLKVATEERGEGKEVKVPFAPCALLREKHNFFGWIDDS